jgi:hypothetical protein
MIAFVHKLDRSGTVGLNGASSRTTPSIVHMRTPRSIGPRLCGTSKKSH